MTSLLVLPAAARAQTAPSTTGTTDALPTTLPTTQATTGPSTAPASRPALATVTPDAQPLLDKLAAAYASPGPTTFAGTIVGTFDVAGRAKTYTLEISGATDGDGRFFHYGRSNGQGVGLLISDGTHGYLYDQHRNAYAELNVSAGRPAPGDLDEAIADVLLDENPALLLSLTRDPAALLRSIVKTIGTDSAGNLVLETPQKRVTLEIDRTGRVTRSTVDYRPIFDARNTAGFKSAAAVLTYTQQAKRAGATRFAWLPPATASQMGLHTGPLRPATHPSEPD